MSKEKTKQISQRDFNEGYFIEVDCGMCHEEKTFGGRTKKELSQTIKEAGWKELDSDYMGMVCYWCGCGYID